MIERKEYAIVHFFEQGGKCYKIDDVTNSPEIVITCTYNTLVYLGKIYQQWIHDQTEDETSD